MNSPSFILIAEDDADDRLMIQEAFQESGLMTPLHFVHDGQELLNRLTHQVVAAHPELPAMIVLDLNMPRKDGREALREIKRHPGLSHIPVVVLTTSKSPEDIRYSYQLGANCYITKPVSFDALLSMVNALNKFWFDVVHLPH